jgi:UDP-N-acetyl-2-amino-2-deoxyglucuronate dehydrogenase
MPTKDGRVGFGVVGLNFGLGRCKALQEIPEAQLVAVCSRTEKTARDIAEQLGVEYHTDYREMLKRDDIDVIVIYTSNAQHQAIALDAAKAGKHVLTTKPLDVTLDRMDTIIEACKAGGVKLATEYMSRYMEGNYLGYRALADGLLGKPVMGEFSYKCYRPQAYYTGTRGTWAGDGGGAMLLQAIHTVDVMLWYLGDVQSVTARWGTFTHEMEAEDTALALVQFTSGALATIVGTTTFHNPLPAGQYGGGSMTRIELGGEHGSIILANDKLTMWKSTTSEEAPTVALPAKNVFQDFARWVRDDNYSSPTLVKGDEARKSVEMILAAYESARTGQTVTLRDAVAS